jgi:sortase A
VRNLGRHGARAPIASGGNLNMAVERPPRFLRTWLTLMLFALGIGCLAFVAGSELDARWFEWVQGRRLDRAIAARRNPTPAPQTGAMRPSGGGLKSGSGVDRIGDFLNSPAGPAAEEGTVLGRIVISRLGVSALVLEGIEPSTLRLGAGHIPRTAMPQGRGNVGIAAHRDSFFGGLKGVTRGDRIQFTTLTGLFEYIVDWTRIVTPSEVTVLAPSERSELTLVTCYPFSYVGAAPERFVVRAHRI